MLLRDDDDDDDDDMDKLLINFFLIKITSQQKEQYKLFHSQIRPSDNDGRGGGEDINDIIREWIQVAVTNRVIPLSSYFLFFPFSLLLSSFFSANIILYLILHRYTIT